PYVQPHLPVPVAVSSSKERFALRGVAHQRPHQRVAKASAARQLLARTRHQARGIQKTFLAGAAPPRSAPPASRDAFRKPKPWPERRKAAKNAVRCNCRRRRARRPACKLSIALSGV